MKTPPHRRFLMTVTALVCLCINFSTAFGVDPSPVINHVEAESTAGQWRFRLFPRAFLANPLVNMTAITEMTEEGRKRPPATPEHPVYFAAYSAGYSELGQDTSARSPDHVLVEKAMEPALAQNGFLPATQRHPPTILLVYYWGVFGDSFSILPSDQLQNIVRRASLVGGGKYAEEVRQAVIAQARYDQDQQTTLRNLSRVQSIVGVAGDQAMGPMLMDFLAPWPRFTHRDQRTGFLTGQSEDPIYSFMVSAYDYALALRKQKLLLWQTKMTAEWGVASLGETLPPLIARGSRYLGRDMDVADTIVQNVNRHAKVTVGDPKFIEFEEPPPPSKAEPKPGQP